MNNRKSALAALGLTSLLLAGCATAAGSVSAPSDVSTTAPAAASPAPGQSGSHGGHHGQGSASPGTATEAPSAAAVMVCGDQPKERLRSILDLDSDPHTVDNWADSTFTCTYHLTEGTLIISVQEAADKASAGKYFDAKQALAKDAAPIEGLANLGFPAYETADGSAVFQKDSFVLQVDASGLPPTLGPENITRNALAYQLSTTILACWVEHQ
ncbi:putative small secreted protein [Pseudarthrobacter siccitolerans]|uniref:Small secreted protein n=1 Tax=Pseudarthrobacter siccitolerans TaxID=861266 RepID=A0ABU0PJ90_9MICC|nr:hypothetical protein [Pseudarthrobacter siccitolerans]MDQ0674033.1 putative small secreted protein [Pseudarthrobacter siccitolerans]